MLSIREVDVFLLTIMGTLTVMIVSFSVPTDASASKYFKVFSRHVSVLFSLSNSSMIFDQSSLSMK
jgi:hypothetical protein